MGTTSRGATSYRLLGKLKLTKTALIDWNKVRIGTGNKKAILDDTQCKLQEEPWNHELVMQERVAVKEHDIAARAEESSQKQNSGGLVITLGDNTTNYIYKSVQTRSSPTRIPAL